MSEVSESSPETNAPSTEGDTRREVLRKAAAAAVVAGGTWAAPKVVGLSLEPEYAGAATIRGRWHVGRRAVSADYPGSTDDWNCFGRIGNTSGINGVTPIGNSPAPGTPYPRVGASDCDEPQAPGNFGNNPCQSESSSISLSGETVNLTWSGNGDGADATEPRVVVDFSSMDPPFNTNCKIVRAERGTYCSGPGSSFGPSPSNANSSGPAANVIAWNQASPTPTSAGQATITWDTNPNWQTTDVHFTIEC